MEVSKTPQVLFSVDENQIATVTLNRPEANNAFTQEMFQAVGDCMEYCSRANEVRAVVLTGAGKNFCAGGDVRRFEALLEQGGALPETGVLLTGRMTAAVRRCAKPVVARINGAAAGAGSALALACDFRVMTSRSRLLGAFVKMGFCGDSGGWYFLSRLIGVARATEFYMLGTPIDGTQALELGLCNRLAQGDELDETTQELALTLATSATRAIACQKKMMNLILYRDLEAITEMERNYMKECSLTADHAEAVHAFLEKRPTHFTGM